MHVDPADVRHIADHEGRTNVFCCAGCRTRLAKNPARFLALA
jgi:YHS domain-containing protein